MELKYFKTDDFHAALRTFFENLNIPVNYIAEEPVRPQEILSNTYKKDLPGFQLMNDVYFLGMVDDAAFEGNAGLAPEKIESDYDGILIFGVTLYPRDNGLLPTRSQLAEITRAFNREFYYTPVVVVFKYENYIAFANAERLKYKQEWREGEKAGKVSLLRDVDLDTPHSGHLRILSELAIRRSGKKAIKSFADLYTYWQSVFNVSLLNKKFYEELSNWYFWAVKEVTFPSEPTIPSLLEETGTTDKNKLKELKQEHNAKNVIRLLTRFLFVWFIKEKKLIPAQLFDLEYLKKEILKDLSPYHEDEGDLFKTANIKSHYYKAILQNLFFATLNQEMGKRAFRKDKQNMNVTNLLRYEGCFKNLPKFISLLESIVPFMNGGLFECLDKPHPTKKGKKGGDVIVYKDGFSDRNDNPLIVPDYLFFGLDEKVDLSLVIGIKNKKTKQAAVKGLINIFESYKFTIAENTPIEEDIALDPELLGKVFENLLASYNPETKTTARKQTGSFYTPREIVNYMVDESLIAYLKNKVTGWGMPEDELDTKLHQLLSFDAINPFDDNQPLQTEIIKTLDHCTILDPACGSGAFPMGILQKMVHILQKVDPLNTHWQELQMEKALRETESAFHLADKEAREQKLIEINEAFDRQVNDPDYARKLFLIENCIYGVDIQPIAAQISKLRFFISLVVDQKVDKTKPNFGIRPLPNLETKFVAANTLIGIEKPENQLNIGNQEIKKLEENLKNVRHRIFSAKTPGTKRKLREEDQELREKMGKLLIADGWENKTARQLAGWDPYDQNVSSPFFDAEWMFGIKDGFDVVIGNPPYHQLSKDKSVKTHYKNYLKNKYKTSGGRLNLFIFFTHEAINLSKYNTGVVSYIIPNTILTQEYYKDTRKLILENCNLSTIVDYDEMPFENAVVENITFILENKKQTENNSILVYKDNLLNRKFINEFSQDSFLKQKNYSFSIYSNDFIDSFFENELYKSLSFYCDVNQGIALKGDKSLSLKSNDPEGKYFKLLDGRNINKYSINWDGVYIDYNLDRIHSCKRKDIFESKEKLFFRRVSKDLIFTYDNEQYFALNTIVVVNLKNNKCISLKYLLAILNSKLLNYLYQNKFKSTKKVFSEIQARSVKELPIVQPNRSIVEIFDFIVNFLLHLKNITEIKLLYLHLQDIIDALVFQLYFPDHMKEKQIDIIQFVEKDLAEVIQTRKFEQLPDSEKEKIINQLYARWTHPDSEVRNRIKLFAVRSPEILKPILESK